MSQTGRRTEGQTDTRTKLLLELLSEPKINILTLYLAGEGRPKVDTGAQPNTEHVLAAPVHEVEIEIVLKLGGVKHLEGDLGDLPGGFPGTPEQLDALGGDRGEGVGGRGLVDDV